MENKLPLKKEPELKKERKPNETIKRFLEKKT